MNRQRISIPLTAGFSLLLVSAIATAIEHPPDVNPANFRANQAINNPFFPLPVGKLFVYDGTKDGIPTHDEVCVTSQKKLIEGVQATVVHHSSFENGLLVENTFDFFAQDVFGNIWYFGEDTTELPSGSTEGSWEAGVGDADAGFIMLANPQAGDRYYQEFARNVAEDQAKVIGRDESVCLESGACYDNLLLTAETSRLDPGVVEYKYYSASAGFILGVMIKGGDERTELVGVGKCKQ
jgi:hypothetical protein